MEMGEKKKGEGGGERERRNRSRRLSQWYLKSSQKLQIKISGPEQSARLYHPTEN